MNSLGLTASADFTFSNKNHIFVTAEKVGKTLLKCTVLKEDSTILVPTMTEYVLVKGTLLGHLLLLLLNYTEKY